MRLRFAAILPFLVLATPAVAEDASFPYKAYVTADDVYVRSGPGKNYYPTSKLAAGTEVEVYRHDPGGWYAIRPPEGSYAWVSGRYLQLTGEGLGKVIGDQVAARVGSDFSDIRDVIQVRLHRGEVVEVLGQQEFAAGSEAGVWYKIAPPSGEFRWIFGKYVDPDYPKDGVRVASAEGNPLLHPTPVHTPTAVETPEPLARQEESPARPAVGTRSSPARGAWAPATPESASSAGDAGETGVASHDLPAASRGLSQGLSSPSHGQVVTAVGTEESARAASSVYATREYHDPADPQTAALPTRKISPQEFQEQLDRLEMDLSLMLVEEPTEWNFDEISLEARSLLLKAETALERGRARTLLNKIAQAADIKQRYDAVAQLRTETERENRQLAALSEARGEALSPAASAGRFDGTGRLARVVSPKLGAPQYALVDENGRVQCYVTPAPGVNMQYYLGQRIGVVGVRGYIAEQRAQHVMAKHVTALDGGTMLR